MTMELEARLGELLRRAAFPHPAANLRLIETHISWVILAGRYAYKLRKPVDFGFLDFTTLAARRADCEAEVVLNRRLCPDLYIGIEDVVEREGQLYIGGPGRALEPAVKMHRIPDSGMLPALIGRRAIDVRLMDRLAKQLAEFHQAAATGAGVDCHGTPKVIRENWTENFIQTASFGGSILDDTVRDTVHTAMETFLATHADLLESRIRNGRIRDGHGDLHAGSVCISRRRLYLFDCIEFNARFRDADVAADVAFLAMDLDHLGRADLGHAFVDAYVRHSGDRELRDVLAFYKCYRAFVRGKVLGFRLVGPAAAVPGADQLRRDARSYFDLAYAYAAPSPRPRLVVCMGLPASGKSTLALALAGRLGLIHVSSDVTRKRLVGLHPTARALEGFERGLYSRAMSRRTYAAMKRSAARCLRRGHSVVLDATYGQPAQRAAIAALARRTGAQLTVLVCRADENTIKARLAARASDRTATSDARLELWPALQAAFIEPSELRSALNVDTTGDLDRTIAQVLAAIRSSVLAAPSVRAA
ncbi:MAG TPA: AAA family ATPase [Chloroflexota bacterium]